LICVETRRHVATQTRETLFSRMVLSRKYIKKIKYALNHFPRSARASISSDINARSEDWPRNYPLRARRPAPFQQKTYHQDDNADGEQNQHDIARREGDVPRRDIAEHQQVDERCDGGREHENPRDEREHIPLAALEEPHGHRDERERRQELVRGAEEFPQRSKGVEVGEQEHERHAEQRIEQIGVQKFRDARENGAPELLEEIAVEANARIERRNDEAFHHQDAEDGADDLRHAEGAV